MEPHSMLSSYLISNFPPSSDALANLDRTSTLLAAALSEKIAIDAQLEALKASTPALVTRVLANAKSSLNRVDTLHGSSSHLLTAIEGVLTSGTSERDALQALIRRTTAEVEAMRRADEVLGVCLNLHDLIQNSQTNEPQINAILPNPTASSQNVQRAVNTASNPSLGILPYDALLDFYRQARQTQSTLLNSTRHTSEFLDSSMDKAYEVVKDRLSLKLQTLLENLQWPEPIDMDSSPLDDFKETFLDLLALDSPHDAIPLSNHLTRLPLDQLLQLPLLSFTYHFLTQRPTNRLDKPEWFFSHILTFLTTHSPFLDTVVLPLLRSHGYTVHPITYFLHALFDAMKRKMRTDLELIAALDDKQGLIMHYMDQVLDFDQSVKAILSPFGLTFDDQCIDVITKHHDWFSTWIQCQVDIGKRIFEVGLEGAWEFVGEMNGSQELDLGDFGGISEMVGMNEEEKVSKLAYNVINLLETMTQKYMALPPHPFLALFTALHLNTLQTLLLTTSSILDSYDREIAILKLPTSDTRGVEMYDRLRKRKGRLEILARVLGTVFFVREVVGGWGEEMFYLGLYDHLQTIKQRPKSTHSSASTSSDEELNETENEEEMTIFDSVCSDYDRTIRRVRDQIRDDVIREVGNGLRIYDRVSFDISETDDDEEEADLHSISPELSHPLRTLTSSLALLTALLPNRLYKQILVRVMSEVEDAFIRIISKKRFCSMGAKKFARDVEGLKRVFRNGELVRLDEFTHILTLPKSTSQTSKVSLDTLLEIIEPYANSRHSRRMNKDKENDELRQVLTKFEIRNLSLEEVLEVLRQRIDVDL